MVGAFTRMIVFGSLHPAAINQTKAGNLVSGIRKMAFFLLVSGRPGMIQAMIGHSSPLQEPDEMIFAAALLRPRCLLLS
jgi:hypothetical protein